jgi:uncharacterized protein
MDLNMIHVQHSSIEAYCRKHHIRSLAFFGSFVRKDFTQESDIDVLVEFEPGQTPGYDFFLLEAELSELLGHKVDLQTLSFLSAIVRQTAFSEAVTIYEQA